MKNKAIYSEWTNPPWDGDLAQIPEKGTLVAIHTASSGLVNHVVEGYKITWHDKRPQIRVLVNGNERFLEELEPPLTIREKQLLLKLEPLK